MENKHDLQCSDCGEIWQGFLATPHYYGTYDPCPHCLSVLGSYHMCCEKEQGLTEKENANVPN